MPAPNGSYAPSPHFAAPRSYFQGIDFNLSGYIITQIDNVYFWDNPGAPFDHWRIEVDERVYDWSSNRYTLDFVIVHFDLFIPPSTNLPDQPFSLNPIWRSGHRLPYYEFRFNGIDFGVHNYLDFRLPSQPYWGDGTEN